MQISNQITFINAKKFIPIKIVDANENFSCATNMTSTSSNSSLIPASNIKFYGKAPVCIAEVAPSLGLVGASDLTIALGESGTSVSFHFEVKPETTIIPALNDSQKNKQAVNPDPPTMFPREVGKMPVNPGPPTMFPREVGKMPVNPGSPTMFPKEVGKMPVNPGPPTMFPTQ